MLDRSVMEVNASMENRELSEAVCRLFREIVEREKKKAIRLDDYATAFVCAILEGILREALMHF